MAPMGLGIRAAVSLLWVARLSRMTTDPGSSSGIGTFSMQLSKASRSRAPEITRGVTVPSQDRPAIKVRLPHRRNGALPLSRSPPGLRPYSRVIPVSVPVSSSKISRRGCLRMAFCRRLRSCLAFRTSGLLRSRAIMPFFICVVMATFICVVMATQQRVDTACRALHVMDCQKGGPQFNQPAIQPE